MRVRRLILGELATNCFLAEDGEGGPLVVVDPAAEPGRLLVEIGDSRVAAVVLTHGHFDHLGAVREILDATGAPLLVHVADAPRIVSPAAEGTGAVLFGHSDDSPPPDRTLVEGDVIEAGSIRLRVLHTPGHTEGSICLLGEGRVFSGDTLFAGSVGRTDLPGGAAAAMRRSVARLASLPDATIVHPGHGPDTTIGRERAVNPFFPRA